MIIKETNYLALFAKSFNWAGFFLPKDTYEECSKLYAFCRVLDDLADANQDLEIKKERFKELKEIALSKGFLLVASSPLTRSSYHADEDFKKLKIKRDEQLKCQQLQ